MQVPSLLLLILSKIFGALTGFRNYLFDQGWLRAYRSALPVVSVGNLTVGGNAKTPLCLYLASKFRERGYSPVVLSRGYGGSYSGPHLLTGAEPAAHVGDEPLLLHKYGVPVVISRRRVAGAKLIEQQGIGDLVILDDGLQHRWLQRNVDIIAVNVSTPQAVAAFLEAKLLPLGKFRESRALGLKRAQMLVCMERGLNVDQSYRNKLLAILPEHLKVYRGSIKTSGVISLRAGDRLPAASRVVVCTGIANPEAFIATLGSLRYEVLASFIFPDHHNFTRADLELIARQHPGLPVVCTEKDAVKIVQLDVALPVHVLPIELEVSPADAFITEIMRRINLRTES